MQGQENAIPTIRKQTPWNKGKLVGQIARRCRETRRPLHVIAGSSTLDGATADRRGIASVSEAGTPEAISEAAALVADPAG